jgi:hypothetical protein
MRSTKIAHEDIQQYRSINSEGSGPKEKGEFEHRRRIEFKFYLSKET